MLACEPVRAVLVCLLLQRKVGPLSPPSRKFFKKAGCTEHPRVRHADKIPDKKSANDHKNDQKTPDTAEKGAIMPNDSPAQTRVTGMV